jgi:hypothetical protein
MYLMSHIRRFDHVGIAAADLDTVTAFSSGCRSRESCPDRASALPCGLRTTEPTTGQPVRATPIV